MKSYRLPFALLLATYLLPACSPTHHGGDLPVAAYSSQAPTPQFINDPYEPVNRGVWAVNKGLLKGVIHPSAKIYRAVVPQPVRRSIKNFDRNITYPGRLVNNVLQGRWAGARDETSRFISNTTVGIGGLFDPATRWGINKSHANFNQTFSKWGWRPKTYVMLPLLGPSDERHTLSVFADRAADPLTYVSQPYQSASYVTTYNGLAEISEPANQLIEIESDSYSIAKYAWCYASRYEQPKSYKEAPIDPSTLQTLAAVSIAPKSKKFLPGNREVKVKIPTTGKNIKFNCWVQPHPSPLVYILPGLTAHRLSNVSLALAETLYEEGYSVVSTTSVFHPEFMENASTANLPIYAPVDSKDLLVALTEMDKLLVKNNPEHFTNRAILGMSMGGYMALNLSIRDENPEEELVSFDRYIAINAPVDMVYSARMLDQFMQAPMAWPEADRQGRINNALHKATASGLISGRRTQNLTIDQIESKYLVGFAFRIGLRDLIFSSQTRNNQGVLQTPLSKWKREPLYKEIINYSYEDYFHKFAVPYYQSKGITASELLRHANLRNSAQKLRNQPKIRIITNSNDFLLPNRDLKWLKNNFSSSQLTVFSQGGHLGNLNDPAVEQAIFKALDDLK